MSGGYVDEAFNAFNLPQQGGNHMYPPSVERLRALVYEIERKL